MAYRASSTSVVIARSSDSRMARPSPSSFNARTPVALHGPSFSEDNTRRVSLRYGNLYNLILRDGIKNGRDEVNCEARRLTQLSPTGSCQEAIAPHSQVTTCHRRCLSRCHQRATKHETRSPQRCTPSCYQGGQGEASCCSEREEG
jgi:hypothetical protein